MCHPCWQQLPSNIHHICQLAFYPTVNGFVHPLLTELFICSQIRGVFQPEKLIWADVPLIIILVYNQSALEHTWLPDIVLQGFSDRKQNSGFQLNRSSRSRSSKVVPDNQTISTFDSHNEVFNSWNIVRFTPDLTGPNH